MNKKINALTRAASKVYEAIVRGRVNRYAPLERSLSKLHSCGRTIQHAAHRLHLATQRQWLAAAGNILFRLRFDLNPFSPFDKNGAGAKRAEYLLLRQTWLRRWPRPRARRAGRPRHRLQTSPGPRRLPTPTSQPRERASVGQAIA